MKKPPRIITGSAKNQKLDVPKKGTRPMTDRVKSALFSMIFEFIPDADILDIFAGTGALGIECLSRGAKFSVFIDRSKHAVTSIHRNLEKTGFESLSKVIKCSASRFLNNYEDFDLDLDEFDIIFVTPPHDSYKDSITELAGQFLKTDGILIAEHSETRKSKEKLDNLERVDQRIYGITALSFYKRI